MNWPDTINHSSRARAKRVSFNWAMRRGDRTKAAGQTTGASCLAGAAGLAKQNESGGCQFAISPPRNLPPEPL